MRDLKRFASRYGFRRTLLQEGRGYRIDDAPYRFDGTVSLLRLERVGRFGNVFTQLLNAALLAHRLDCTTIEMFRFDGAPAPARIADLTFRYADLPDEAAGDGPALTGPFLETFHFGDALDAVPPDAVAAVIDRYLKPLFAAVRGSAADMSARTLVMHFRAGDVFLGAVHPWYAQPPASYYAMAVLHAQATLDIEDVVLVFEDRGNPAIADTERFLASRRIPYRVQSATFETDLACLVGARHLVASNGTLCEAAALLSDPLRTYVAFRALDSQAPLHTRKRPLFPDLLALKRVSTILIEDMGGYIPRLDWRCSAEQLDMIRTYPISSLSLVTDPAPAPYLGPRMMLAAEK